MAAPDGKNYEYVSSASGVSVYSNINPNASQPAGSVYTYTLYFTAPFLNDLAAGGIDILNFFDPSYLISAFGQQNHQITNVSVNPTANNTLTIKFTSSSPAIVEAATIIIGVILAIVIPGIGAIVGAILVFLGAAGLVLGAIIATVESPFVAIGKGLGPLAPIALAAGVGLVLYAGYKYIKDKGFRGDINKGAGKAYGAGRSLAKKGYSASKKAVGAAREHYGN